MYVRQLNYSVAPGQSENFALMQQHAATMYRRHGLVRFLILTEPDAPDKITEFQVFYDKASYHDSRSRYETDPLYENVKTSLNEITGGTRSEDRAQEHSLILDIGGATRG